MTMMTEDEIMALFPTMIVMGEARIPMDEWTRVPGYERVNGRSMPPVSAINAAGQSIVAAIRNASPDDLVTMQTRARETSLGAEIPVTAEMIEVGRRNAYGPGPDTFDFGAIYRAMAALAPVELVSEGERQAVRERDEMLTALNNIRERNTTLEAEVPGRVQLEIAGLRVERDEALAMRDTVATHNRLLEATVEGQHRAMLAAQERESALRMELMAVHDRLAAFTAANVPDATRPAADWTRVPPPDRWRMGPEGI